MNPLHVAVAVIRDAGGRVLLSRRARRSHQGGLWEFPGGKLEPGESLDRALRREIDEELGLRVAAHSPLIRIHHDYPDRSVLLDVRVVDEYYGTPGGREGQPLAWVHPSEMSGYPMPAADNPIVSALRLPDTLLVTGGAETMEERAFLQHLQASIEAGVRLVQLRAPLLDSDAYRALAVRALPLCRQRGVELLLNASPALARELGADGVHLSSQRLMSLARRPLDADQWVSASCHNHEQLRHAEAVGVDFALLSPVLPTASHPHAVPIGWQGFQDLVDRTVLPVYALGGMLPDMVAQARNHGGQGIAAIRGLWGGDKMRA